MYKITQNSIPNDWQLKLLIKLLLRTETSHKSFIKTFCYNNKVTKSLIKSLRLPKLSNKEIYFTLLSNIISNSTKYNLSNSFHGQTSQKHYIRNPDIWGKTFTNS